MDIGFGAPVSGAWATPQNLAAFATAAERAGYHSLWTFQRLLVPSGSGMDPVYHSVLDPMAALSFAAAVTSSVRLGVAVVNLPFVSPGYLAKQAASLDVVRRAARPRARHRVDATGVRADAAWLGERGITEVFYDLNWDPLVGAPDADPQAAVARAEEILHELAPAAT